MKRFFALAFAAALALGVFAAAPASAACHPGADGGNEIDNPATGGYIYADGSESDMEGHVGTKSDDGSDYLQVNAGADGTLLVHGNYEGDVYGQAGLDGGNPTVCVLGESV